MSSTAFTGEPVRRRSRMCVQEKNRERSGNKSGGYRVRAPEREKAISAGRE